MRAVSEAFLDFLQGLLNLVGGVVDDRVLMMECWFVRAMRAGELSAL